MIQFYLNNTINLRHSTQRIKSCYTHNMAIVALWQQLWCAHTEWTARSHARPTMRIRSCTTAGFNSKTYWKSGRVKPPPGSWFFLALSLTWRPAGRPAGQICPFSQFERSKAQHGRGMFTKWGCKIHIQVCVCTGRKERKRGAQTWTPQF